MTDFGLTYALGQQVAYLVMELLEGRLLLTGSVSRQALAAGNGILQRVASAVDGYRAGLFISTSSLTTSGFRPEPESKSGLDFGLADLRLPAGHPDPTDSLTQQLAASRNAESTNFEPRPLFSVVEETR